MKRPSRQARSGAESLVDCLSALDVRYVFGVPGGSLMPILDVLHDRGPEFVVCRHEQNAAFMAQAWGRLTGTPGVCMATAGPGATNMATAAATATADRDPLVVLTGQTPRDLLFQNHHQNIDAAALFRPVTKWSVEVEHPDAIPEVIAQAFRHATSARRGAVHVALPMDVLMETARRAGPVVRPPATAAGPAGREVERAATALRRSRSPVMLVGVGASTGAVTAAVRGFLQSTGIPAVCTYQASGVVGRALLPQFLGRVGLAAEEPADRALREADVVLAAGYDVVEYAPEHWPTRAGIIHVDELEAGVHSGYDPAVELIGDIAASLDRLLDALGPRHWELTRAQRAVQCVMPEEQRRSRGTRGVRIHPARLVHELRAALADDDLVVADVGAHQVWLAREYFAFEPRTLLFSMGFQTMGVSLPWAMAARLHDRRRRIVSCSGDGSFLMCAMELETAVRLKLPIVHLVWRDGTYNLVEIQQRDKYGRTTGTKFGNPDIVKLAESFGAVGMRVSHPDQFAPALERALSARKPVVIDVPVDYRQNLSLLGKGNMFGG
jgi:acetolactate synthase I/II/III large subunit